MEVISNWLDCFGYFGVVCEIVVFFGLFLNLFEVNLFELVIKLVYDLIKICIDVLEFCFCYMVCVICGVKVGLSFDWLIDCLEVIGCVLVNNIVDVMNYVMFELG